MTNGEDRKDLLLPPFHMAHVAAAIDVEVKMVFTGRSGKLLIKGNTDRIYPKDGGEALLETLRKVKKAGVKLYVCSPVLDFYDLKKDDFIEEVDGFVGAMFVVTESLEADVTYTF